MGMMLAEDAYSESDQADDARHDEHARIVSDTSELLAQVQKAQRELELASALLATPSEQGLIRARLLARKAAWWIE